MRRLLAEQRPRLPRRAVRTQVLAAGMQAALGSAPDDLSAAAALSLAFCGLLRVSEYTTASAAVYDRRRLPTVGDVSFSTDEFGDMATVMVRPAKKGGRSQGKNSAVVVRDGELIQPVTALQRMLGQRRAAPHEPLFLWRGRPLTSTTVSRLLKFVVKAAGSCERGIGSHSLRIGGATAALAAGVPPEAIRLMGRWDSDVYEIYCRQSRQAAMRIGMIVASTPFNDFQGAFEDEELM